MVFILGVMTEFLYSGVAFWNKNDRAYQRQQQLKFIYQMLQNDFDAVYAQQFLPEAALRGENDQVAFWLETGDGLIQKGYRFEREDQLLSVFSGYWGSQPELRPILDKVQQWEFEYFDPVTKNWLLSWNPTRKNALPSLVRVKVTTKAGNLGSLVFPIRTQSIEGME